MDDGELESNNLCKDISIIKKINLNELEISKKLNILENKDIKDIINFYKEMMIKP